MLLTMLSINVSKFSLCFYSYIALVLIISFIIIVFIQKYFKRIRDSELMQRKQFSFKIKTDFKKIIY